MRDSYKTEKIGVTALCRVSAKGGEGVYLYIPKNFADVYGIAAAEYCEVTFGKAVFLKGEPQKKKKGAVEDLRKNTKRGITENETSEITEGELTNG
jgi:hypothetical protein